MTTPDHDAASPAPTLPELRDRIDALDRELIAMLNRRARLAQEAAQRAADAGTAPSTLPAV